MSNTTDTKDKVIIGGALVGGLLFFGFLTNTCQSPLSYLKGSNPSTDSIATTSGLGSDDYNTKIAGLENDIKALEDNSADEQVIAGLRAEISSAKAQLADLSKAKADLQANLPSAPAVDTSELNAKITSLTNQNSHAKTTITNLEAQLKDAMSADVTGPSVALAAGDAAKVNLEQANTIKLLRNENDKLSKDLVGLGASLQKANESAKTAAVKGEMPDLSGKVADLEKSITGITKENTDLKAKLANLGSTGGDMDAKLNALSKLSADQKTELANKNGEITKLNAQVNQLKAAKKVFVKSSDDLPKTAQALFADLKTLEGKSADQVKDAYTEYGDKHKATSKLRIKFGSGKSEVSSADQEKIAQLTKSAGENAYFLIVGFADKSGTAASNEKLSSARSSKVAKQVSGNSKGFQAAQAVYLGQTNRFGAPSENRVVEIWQIK